MANVVPISLEILACFIMSTAMLHRYCDMVNSNFITVVSVFISWFFSFMVIFMLPSDLTSTAYRQCLYDYQASINSTTPAPSINDTNLQTAGMLTTTFANAAIIPQNSVLTHQNLSTTTPIGFDTKVAAKYNEVINPCIQPWNFVPDAILMKLWRFIYWTSQMLTWLVMPIMQSYSMAGDFTTVDKLKSAVRANLIYYSSLGAIFIVLLIYVITKIGLDFANLKVIAISSSNTWGLFLLVILLGYGLVELPRFLLSRSKYAQSLNRQYFRVAKLNAEKCEAEEKLDDALEEIHQTFAVIEGDEHNPMRLHLNKIVNKCPPDWKRRSNAFRRQAAASNSTHYDADRSRVRKHDINSMIRLHRKVIGAVHYHRQITCRWNHVIKEVIEWEDVVKNQSESIGSVFTRTFKSTLPKERSIIHTVYTPNIEWFWKCLARVWLYRISGYMVAAFSLAVVWSEIAFPISIFSPKLSIFAYLVDNFQDAQRYFYLELFSTLSIGYLAVCAFYTVFHMKIYNVYYLASNKQTDEYSLLFSGMLLCRLTAPLCLNYLCLVHRDSHIIKQNSRLETSFTTIMGHLDLIPFVNNGLNVFLPLCISAICSAIYFNFGTQLLHRFGFDQFIEDDEMTFDWVQTGRELVRRETTKLLRTFDPSSAAYLGIVSTTGDSSQTGTDLNTRKPVEQNDNSPSSVSSASSGLSGSSLLPRGQRVANQGTSLDPTATLPAIRRADNVIEIETSARSNESKRPTGFFDDV